jgi:hypothetical protein
MKVLKKQLTTSAGNRAALGIIVVLAVVGGFLVIMTRAAGIAIPFEAESSTLANGATTGSVSGASGGSFVQFHQPPAGGGGGAFCGSFPAVPSARPDATNTGVPAGTQLSAYSGSLTISTAGTTIDSKDIPDGLTIAANNVTIKNSKIHPPSGVFTNSRGERENDTMGIRINDSATGLKILNSEIYTSQEDGYIGILGGNATVCGSHIHGYQNGMTIGENMMIQANYIHGLFATGTGGQVPHQDGIEVYSGSNTTIVGNTIMVNLPNGTWLDETNAINITAYQGNISNIVENHNWVGGGSYTLGVRQQNTSKYSNVTLTNNRFLGSPPSGFASGGPCDIQPTPVTKSGNVWDASGQPAC